MGLLGDLALGILDYALAGKKTGVMFHPLIGFHIKELRNKEEETLLIGCSNILNLSFLELTNNRKFLIDNGGNIKGFVVTNGKTTILQGLRGLGELGLVVTGADAAEILQKIVVMIQELGYHSIELCDDQIPFHDYDWLWSTKSILEKKAREKLEQESEENITAENIQDEDEDPAQELPAPAEQENPAYTSAQFEEIKSLCYDLLPKFGEGAATSLDKKNRMKMLAERLILADEAPEKILAAKESFAKNCKDDIPLLMYDETLRKNGTQGFLLTNKKLYIGNAYEEPAEIDLSEIHTVESQAKILSSFITINGIKFETSTLLKKQLPLMTDFLQKAIPLAMKVE